MGSFNVTCCVSKTPITVGEKCHLVVFSGIKLMDLVYSESMIFSVASSNDTRVVHGEYDDYGRIKDNKLEFFNNSEPEDSSFGFYISDDAWELGKSLTGEDEYSRVSKHFREKVRVNHLLDKLDGKTSDQPSGESIDDREVLVVLMTFCNLNNFNMFDPSFQNTYGSQSYSISDKEKFNKLRERRVKMLKKEESRYE